MSGVNDRQLHRDENVLFAGYKLPHPLQYKIIVRVSVNNSGWLLLWFVTAAVYGLVSGV